MKKNNNIRIQKWVGARASQSSISSLEHKVKKLHPVCTVCKYAM